MRHTNSLAALGWSAHFEEQWNALPAEPHAVAGRVVEVQRDLALLATPDGEVWTALAGRFRHDVARPSDLPAVGDFAVARHRPGDDRAVLLRLLQRKSHLSRKAPETGVEQTIVANVDVAFVVTATGHDLNVRRVERYLSMVWDGGALPVVVLTKADQTDDVDRCAAEVGSASPGVRVVVTSAYTGAGVDELARLVAPGQTAVLLGSSGTGKSTLVNALVGQAVQAVSVVSGHRDKGRHTTTARRLVHLPGGGMIIDTPGLRELQLMDVEQGVSRTFDDVERLVARCRFTDCQHRTEPGCAVRAALQSGELDADRFNSYRKLQREAAYEARQSDANLMRAERERWKKIAQQGRANMRRKRLW